MSGTNEGMEKVGRLVSFKCVYCMAWCGFASGDGVMTGFSELAYLLDGSVGVLFPRNERVVEEE